MTRPIFEPSPERMDSYLNFGQEQLFRRPAPKGSGGIPYCWMRWVGTEAVTVTTLTNVASLLDYEESFIYDPEGLAGFSANRTSGCIHWDNPGEYFIAATLEFDGGATAGSTLASVLDIGEDCSFSTFRAVGMIVADAINETMHIPVHWMAFDFLSDKDSVRQMVYHNDAGGQSLARADIHVWQMNRAVSGTFDPP